MNELAQFAALRTWLIAETGLATIIRAHPNAPRPAKPYAMANLIRAERINWPDDLEYEDIPSPGDGFPVRQIPVETWEWTWSAHFYGDAGLAHAARITSASKSGASLERLHPLTLNRTSGIRRIPELLNETEWEDRVQVDLFLRGIVRHGFDSDIIQQGSAVVSNTDDTEFGTATASIIPE